MYLCKYNHNYISVCIVHVMYSDLAFSSIAGYGQYVLLAQKLFTLVPNARCVFVSQTHGSLSKI